MQIATAKAAGTIATSIESLTTLIAGLDLAIGEGWLVTRIIATAPAVGSSAPEGTAVEVIPEGQSATPANSNTILTTVRARAQTVLDGLNTQLAGL